MASLINPIIDITYPIAGQDNDTQGFRDNFSSIKNNLNIAKNEISDLQLAVENSYGNTQVAAYLTHSNVTVANLTITSTIQFANLTNTQVTAISTPARGMTVYNYTTGNIQVYNGTKWANITLS